jgi:hypothetical protein
MRRYRSGLFAVAAVVALALASPLLAQPYPMMGGYDGGGWMMGPGYGMMGPGYGPGGMMNNWGGMGPGRCTAMVPAARRTST